MGKIDTDTRHYFMNTEVAADIINLQFPKLHVKPNDIQFIVPSGELVNIDHELIPFHRDILMKVKSHINPNRNYYYIGMELQTYIDYSLPIRAQTYDTINYQHTRKEFQKYHSKHKDLKRKEYISGISFNDSFIPITTLSLWLGVTPFKGHSTLSELLDLNEEEKEIFLDYGLHTLIPATLSDETIREMKTDCRELFWCLKYSRNKKELERIVHQPDFRHVSWEAAKVIKDCLNFNVKIEKEKDGKVSMCKAIEDIRNEGRTKWTNIGIQQGLEQGIGLGKLEARKEIAVNLLHSGMSLHETSKATGLDLAAVEQLFKLSLKS